MDIREINRTVITRFRAGEDPEGMHRDRLLLLTTTGRRSGTPHTAPMAFFRHGDTPVVFASNMGAAQHPQWYRNLLADPHVTVELPDETYQGRARTAAGEERARLWAMAVEQYPFLPDHQQKAGEREIPLVVLERAG
ncbi:deazaflavin-dependent oxidoreductase, nitroreductase family [Pseudonocardia thermophila]|uniref:Deazaflavin-dependent oxidoreductase, nitroreductase family n=1 Tax=Pseudonocardia thermophila TaxID=1848 RepID=A0A1M6YJM5_PSETH|nr:nitroreductase/quinone reductase family protein [Pseudonocardia thermophila]SHL18447.1 deazaflavin-dependent oxidoreductase, nitroreductase family [Pseudonocardia thermophila]